VSRSLEYKLFCHITLGGLSAFSISYTSPITLRSWDSFRIHVIHTFLFPSANSNLINLMLNPSVIKMVKSVKKLHNYRIWQHCYISFPGIRKVTRVKMQRKIIPPFTVICRCYVHTVHFNMIFDTIGTLIACLFRIFLEAPRGKCNIWITSHWACISLCIKLVKSQVNLAITSCGWNTCCNTRELLWTKYFIFHLVLYLWKKINILAVLPVVFLAQKKFWNATSKDENGVEHVGFQMQMMRLGQCEMWIQWQGVTLFACHLVANLFNPFMTSGKYMSRWSRKG